MIIDKDFDGFWDHWVQNGKRREMLSHDCKTLIWEMLAFNPFERPTIEDVLADPWLNDQLQILSEQKTVNNLGNMYQYLEMKNG